jgi:hypothetical protein
MLTHPTLDQMASLGLNGMAAAWRALAEQDPGEALDRNEWLGMMLDREVAHRADKRCANRLGNAKMRFPNACIEDIRFTATRGLDRRQILSLGQGGWLKAHEQIILLAKPAPAKPGLPVHSPIKRPAWIIPWPVPACRACLKIWPQPASTDDFQS